MTKRLLRIWGVAMTTLALLTLASCDSAKRTNYLQDIEVAKAYGVKHDVGIVVQKGDKLRIIVSSLASPELALPFNSRLAAPRHECTCRSAPEERTHGGCCRYPQLLPR